MSRSKKQQFYRLRSGLMILPSQQKEIDKLLTKLVQKVPAKFVLLSDVTGQVVSARGEQGNIDLIALASLLAGDLAASQEISRLTGEFEDYQLVLREGQLSNTFICESGSHLALLVQVSNEVPMGWARMIIKDVAHQLPGVLEEDIDENAESFNESVEEPVFEEDNLSDLFDDALDDLWAE